MVNWWWCTDVHRLACKTLKSKVTIQTWTMSMTTKPIMVAKSWRSPPTSFSLSLWSTWELSVKWIQVNFIYTVLIATAAPPPAINTHKSGRKWPRGCPKKVLFRNWWLRTNGLLVKAIRYAIMHRVYSNLELNKIHRIRSLHTSHKSRLKHDGAYELYDMISIHTKEGLCKVCIHKKSKVTSNMTT